MKKTVFIYGGILAGILILLKAIEYFNQIKLLPTSVYIALIALLFTVFGIWLGKTLTSPKQKNTEKPAFQRNKRAIKSLGLSDRELDVLVQLGKGRSNQEIANKLFISINTVKTHLSSLYQKLEVKRRSLAVKKARTLRLIP